MKRNKLLILLGVVLLIVWATFSGKNLLLSGWETYTDADAGFSIKYPHDWQIEESSELMIQDKGKRIFKESVPFFRGIHIYISRALVAEELVIRNYLLDPETVKETKTQIGNYEATTISFSSNLPSSYYSIDRNDKSYIFIARGDEEKVVLQKMLSTLAFFE